MRRRLACDVQARAQGSISIPKRDSPSLETLSWSSLPLAAVFIFFGFDSSSLLRVCRPAWCAPIYDSGFLCQLRQIQAKDSPSWRP